LPSNTPYQAQTVFHQMMLTRLTSTAFYQAFTGWVTSTIWSHCSSVVRKRQLNQGRIQARADWVATLLPLTKK